MWPVQLDARRRAPNRPDIGVVPLWEDLYV